MTKYYGTDGVLVYLAKVFHMETKYYGTDDRHRYKQSAPVFRCTTPDCKNQVSYRGLVCGKCSAKKEPA